MFSDGMLFLFVSICAGVMFTPCHSQTQAQAPTPAPVPLPNFPISCGLVNELRPGWDPLDESVNGNNGVFFTHQQFEWNDWSNQAFPGQTLVYKLATHKYQHWNVSYTDYQFHYDISLKGCAVIADSTSPTGYWEYWGITIPQDYPLDWSLGIQGVIGHEWFFWTYGPVDYPMFQPTVTSRVEIIPLNITGSGPITCPEGTYVCTAIGNIGWTYNQTTHQNTTIQGLQQQCYSVALGDLNGCQSWYHHNRHFPDPNSPSDAPTEPPPQMSIVALACGTDAMQLCANGKCLLLNETCEPATSCAETRDCPVGEICRSSDYNDANSYNRTCQYVNDLNDCPKLDRQPWTQAQCDQFLGPYKGWSPCDQYINTTYHDGCRTDYCRGDCTASYLIISCQDMLNGTIMACPFGTSPGYSPFVSGQCLCSDSWDTL